MGAGLDQDNGVGIAAVAEGAENCEVNIFDPWCVLSKTFEQDVSSFLIWLCRSGAGVGGRERILRLRERSRLGVGERDGPTCCLRFAER